MVVRKEPTYQELENIYRTIQKIFKDKDIYYTHQEVEELKKDRKNIFIKKTK